MDTTENQSLTVDDLKVGRWYEAIGFFSARVSEKSYFKFESYKPIGLNRWEVFGTWLLSNGSGENDTSYIYHPSSMRIIESKKHKSKIRSELYD